MGKGRGIIVNKKRIDNNIGKAYDILKSEKVAIAKNGQISKGYRSQISSFGAAISSGSLLAAIAFFSDKGNAQVERQNLMQAIMELIKANHKDVKEDSLFVYVRARQSSESEMAKLKEEILDYTIAIKLAMNLYVLTADKKKESGE